YGPTLLPAVDIIEKDRVPRVTPWLGECAVSEWILVQQLPQRMVEALLDHRFPLRGARVQPRRLQGRQQLDHPVADLPDAQLLMHVIQHTKTQGMFRMSLSPAIPLRSKHR